MIVGAEQLGQAIEQMGRMQRILESYRNEILTKNARNFALLAEGWLEQAILRTLILPACFSASARSYSIWSPSQTSIVSHPLEISSGMIRPRVE